MLKAGVPFSDIVLAFHPQKFVL
ncbi:hypothetical protein [Microcoleus sp. FACHB-SPT15]